MTKHDQALLEKQLWGVSPSPREDGIIILTVVAMFLVGVVIGDFLSNTKQANTNYAAVISRITGAPQ
jgi:hypothetical protein